MRFFSRSIMGVFLAAVTFSLLLAATQVVISAASSREGGRPDAIPEERVFAANVIRVEPTRILPSMTAYGEVRARRTLQLRSAGGGVVVDVAPGFEEGAAVSEGDLLIQLDPANALSARDLAQAGVIEALAEEAQAKADLAFAQDDLAAAERQFALREQAKQRQDDLRTRGLGSDAAAEEAALALSAAEQGVLSRRQALLQAEARVERAASSLQRAQIALTDAERALQETAIYAPFDGKLTAVNVSLGGLVGPNEVLAEVIDPKDLEVMIRLSATQFGNLPALDTAATVFTVSGGQGDDWMTGSGVLTRVGARVAEGESGRVVYGSLNNMRGLFPGDFVTVSLREPPLHDVAILPATAVAADGTVLALAAENRLEVIAVEVVRRYGDDVIVAPGDAAGREVVAERSPLLGAGIRISPVRAGWVTLSAAQREALKAAVDTLTLTDAEKADVLGQLEQAQVPQSLIDQLQPPAGG
jgi:RND family efflux transporter MFP subunit